MRKEVFENKRIICFGDSITDFGRTCYTQYEDGSGYVNMLKTKIGVFDINKNIEVINKGYSGDKTDELLKRLKDDVLDLKPDVVTMLIGINDIWHPFDRNDSIDFVNIDKNYRQIVETIIENNIRLIILTPFLLPTSEYFEKLMIHYNTLRNIVLQIIADYKLEFIDLQIILEKYAKVSGNGAIAADSVHPTILGHGIIAHELEQYLLFEK